MPMNAEQKELLRIQGIYKSVHSTIQSKYKGVVVSTFSQSIQPVTSFLNLNKDTKDGVCQALVNRWIAAHAAEGSLWNELYTTVNNQNCIKIDAMRSVMAEFVEGMGGTHKGSMGAYQKLNTEVWLMRRGVIPRMSIAGGHRIYEEGYKKNVLGTMVADPNLGTKVMDALPAARAFGLGEGSYAMISVKAAKGGHVMCAYLGGGGSNKKYPYSDVAFFDPNLGEFWFDNGENFAKFFNYLCSILYKDFAGFQIRSFGKRARFAA